MKKLMIFETITGHWLAGVTSYDQVTAETRDEALRLWREYNPGRRVTVVDR